MPVYEGRHSGMDRSITWRDATHHTIGHGTRHRAIFIEGESVTLPLFRDSLLLLLHGMLSEYLVPFVFSCFLSRRFYCPAQRVGGFTLRYVLDKPCSQVSPLSPPPPRCSLRYANGLLYLPAACIKLVAGLPGTCLPVTCCWVIVFCSVIGLFSVAVYLPVTSVPFTGMPVSAVPGVLFTGISVTGILFAAMPTTGIAVNSTGLLGVIDYGVTDVDRFTVYSRSLQVRRWCARAV